MQGGILSEDFRGVVCLDEIPSNVEGLFEIVGDQRDVRIVVGRQGLLHGSDTRAKPGEILFVHLLVVLAGLILEGAKDWR